PATATTRASAAGHRREGAAAARHAPARVRRGVGAARDASWFEVGDGAVAQCRPADGRRRRALASAVAQAAARVQRGPRAGRRVSPRAGAAQPAPPVGAEPAVSYALLTSLYYGEGSNADLTSRAARETLHLPTRLEGLVPDLLRRGLDVVLTGNPGDGKS